MLPITDSTHLNPGERWTWPNPHNCREGRVVTRRPPSLFHQPLPPGLSVCLSRHSRQLPEWDRSRALIRSSAREACLKPAPAERISLAPQGRGMHRCAVAASPWDVSSPQTPPPPPHQWAARTPTPQPRDSPRRFRPPIAALTDIDPVPGGATAGFLAGPHVYLSPAPNVFRPCSFSLFLCFCHGSNSPRPPSISEESMKWSSQSRAGVWRAPSKWGATPEMALSVSLVFW